MAKDIQFPPGSDAMRLEEWARLPAPRLRLVSVLVFQLLAAPGCKAASGRAALYEARAAQAFAHGVVGLRELLPALRDRQAGSAPNRSRAGVRRHPPVSAARGALERNAGRGREQPRWRWDHRCRLRLG